MYDAMKNILNLLCMGKLPSDDTLLEKLVDWMRKRRVTLKNADELAAFLEETNYQRVVEEFVSDRIGHPTPQLCAFLLKSSFMIVKDGSLTVAKNNCLIQDLVKKSKDPTNWQHALVRHSFCGALINLLKGQQDSELYMKNEELLQVVQEGIYDSSLFVAKAAADLLGVMLARCLNRDQTQEYSIQLKHFLFKTLQNGMHDKTRRMEETLLLLIDTIEKVVPMNQKLLHTMTLQWKIPHEVLSLVGVWSDNKAILNKVLTILNVCQSNLDAEFWEEVAQNVFTQVEDDNFFAAVYIANWLIGSPATTSVSHRDKLYQIAHLPVNACLQKPVDDSLSSMCRDRSRVKSLVLLQLHLMANRIKTVSDAETTDLLDFLAGCQPQQKAASMSTLCTAVVRSKHAQFACLDVLRLLLKENLMSDESCARLGDWCLIQLQLNTADIGYRGVAASLECLLLCVTQMCSSSRQEEVHVSDNSAIHGQTKALLAGLVLQIERLLCHLMWEIRDCALEFCAKLLSKHLESPVLASWFVDMRILHLVDQCSNDGESYVRASVVKVFSEALDNPHARTALFEQFEPDVLSARFTETLRSDPGAFARRAAGVAFQRLLQHGGLSRSSRGVLAAMRGAARDEDWEVKLTTLGYWRSQIDQIMGAMSPTAEICSTAPEDAGNPPTETGAETPGEGDTWVTAWAALCRSGCVCLLLELVQDCDKSVALEAGNMLHRLRSSLQAQELSSGRSEKDLYTQMMDCNNRNPGSNNPDVRTSSRDPDDIASGSEPETTQNGKSRREPASPSAVEATPSDAELYRAVFDLDLESLLREASRSADEHADNPESLFEDLLASMCDSTEYQGEEFEDNAVDCY